MAELLRSAFRVIRTECEKHASKKCDRIVQATAPSRPIERGIAGPGLLARVLTSKYAGHTPLNRQPEIYERQDVTLSRSLLSGWVDACCQLLSPLDEALSRYVLTDGKLHADDTPVPVMAPAVWFAYSPDRKGVHPQTHLAGFNGGCRRKRAGFNELYREGHIKEAACRAHARRKIHDVHVRTSPQTTSEALHRIGKLYVIESALRGKIAAERPGVRQEKTLPLLNALEGWLREKQQTLSRHSELAKAFAYALNQWEALKYYASDG